MVYDSQLQTNTPLNQMIQWVNDRELYEILFNRNISSFDRYLNNTNLLDALLSFSTSQGLVSNDWTNFLNGFSSFIQIAII